MRIKVNNRWIYITEFKDMDNSVIDTAVIVDIKFFF